MTDEGDREIIFREEKERKRNALAFGFASRLFFCFVLFCVCFIRFCFDLFYDGFVVCCFGGFRFLFV